MSRNAIQKIKPDISDIFLDNEHKISPSPVFLLFFLLHTQHDLNTV